MDRTDNSDERSLGFRDAPKRTTPACMSDMGRIIGLREFTGVVFAPIKASPTVGGSDSTVADVFKKLARRNVLLNSHDWAKHRQFVSKVMLARAAESFDLCVLNILRLVSETQPNMLKSEAPNRRMGTSCRLYTGWNCV